MPKTLSFPKSARLLTAVDFANVFDTCSKRASSRIGTILSSAGQQHCSRLGVIVAKRQVKHACKRNQIKRVARESFRTRNFSASADFVFLAKHSCNKLSKKELAQELEVLWLKIERTSNHRSSR